MAVTSRAQERTRRRVLDTARAYLDAHGVEQLSMRRLAEEAGVSVRTLYNHFGDRDGLLTALIRGSLDSLDVATQQLSSTDPLDRIWEAVAVSIDTLVAEIPRSVVRAVLMDDRMVNEVNRGWTGWEPIVAEIRAATRRGVLRDDVDPAVLADHAAMVLFHLQRRWTAGEIDTDELRAGARHAFDLCLLTIARPRARARILAHARSLHPDPPARSRA